MKFTVCPVSYTHLDVYKRQMLPHKLSNGICSLNAGTDRLALSCIMELDAQGNVLGHKIAETVIHVDRRMTYTAVNAIVTDGDEAVMAEYEGFVPMFMLMKEVSDILREKRKKPSLNQIYLQFHRY